MKRKLCLKVLEKYNYHFLSLHLLPFLVRGASFYGGDILDASSGLGGLGAITMLRGKKNSHFELNAGAFLGIDHSESVPFIFPILNIGYRYQKPRSRFIFRVNAGIGSVGLSFGKAF